MAERLHQGAVGRRLGAGVVLTVTVTYAPLNTDVTQVQTFVYGGQRMIYTCCNENRKAAVLGNPDAQRHRLSRGAGPRGVRRAVRASRRCWCIASSRAARPTLTPGERPDHGRREHHRHHRAVDRAGLASPPPQATPTEAALFRRRLPTRPTSWWFAPTRRAIFRPTRLRLVNDAAQAAQDPFDVTEVLTGSIRSWPRSSSPSRSSAARTSTARPQPPTARPTCRRRRRSTIWPRTTAASARSCSTA